jgi:hypothetical protein
MINFNSAPYEWQKDMKIIIQNVNLSKIDFFDNNSISFDFLNSTDGNSYKRLTCSNVWKFSIENNIEKGEGLPFFICDIRLAKLEQSEIEGAFIYLNYGFGIPSSEDYMLLCMDSGDISIALICEIVEVE